MLSKLGSNVGREVEDFITRVIDINTRVINTVTCVINTSIARTTGSRWPHAEHISLFEGDRIRQLWQLWNSGGVHVYFVPGYLLFTLYYILRSYRNYVILVTVSSFCALSSCFVLIGRTAESPVLVSWRRTGGRLRQIERAGSLLVCYASRPKIRNSQSLISIAAIITW